MFLLPKTIISAVEKRCSDVLWNVGDGGKKKAKIAWKTVALLRKKEVLDLGIYTLGTFLVS